MKIRKVFENLDAYYTKIDNYPRKSITEYITQNQMDDIIENFPQIRRPLQDKATHINPFKLICDRIYFEISIDDDEWYYLRMYDRNKDRKDGTSSHMSIYKCDQWDGLLDCIEKEVVDKSD